MTKKAYKEFTCKIKMGKKSYIFLVKLSILLLAVVAGATLLWFLHHPAYKELMGALGLAKFIELVGEAAEEAIGDNI